MKKRDLKSLALMGIASGALIASQAGAEEMTINMETTLAAGCGGNGACGGATPPPPQQARRASSSNYQPSGHSCSSQPNYNTQPQTSNKPTQGSNYSQKNTRYSRQIAEGEETAPSTGDSAQPPKQEGQNGCNQHSGCGGKKPSQYRTRS